MLPVLVLTVALGAAPAAAQEAFKLAPRSDALRYRLVVEGPNPPAAAIREGLDLARWQSDEDMTLDLLELLVREGAAQAREIAATQGFYDAKVDIAIDRNARPHVVTVRVEPGPPVRVRSVDVAVTGPAASDRPLGTDAIREAREGWRLRLGEVFRQADWIEAKAQALRTMHRSPYAAARIARSEARVEPERRAAELSLDIESGPAFAFGPLAVEGVKRYPASLVERFSTLERGKPYTEAELDDYVRSLAASGYFGSVHASIDTEAADPREATVRVAVTEAPTHRFEGSLAYSTDTKFGVRASYTNVNLDGNAMQLRAEARVESLQQLAKVAFTWPPTASRWIDSLTVSVQRTDLQNVVESTAGIGVARRGIDERRHAVYAASYYYDRQEPEGAPKSTAYATYLEAGHVWRRVDDLLSPTRGFMADVRVGAGVPGLSSEGFGRIVALTAAWYPIDRMTQLAFRAEAGSVIGASRRNVPSVLRFRTGGDTSVRGYEYQSLGVKEGEATVGGRHYALASVEAIRWINETWGAAAFVDAGDATDALDDLRFAVGYGLGARLRTPIGPFRLDVAYGERTHKWRVHFSVGLTF